MPQERCWLGDRCRPHDASPLSVKVDQFDEVVGVPSLIVNGFYDYVNDGPDVPSVEGWDSINEFGSEFLSGQGPVLMVAKSPEGRPRALARASG